MISYLSKSIALFLHKNNIINNERLPVCEYGFELIIATILGFALVLLSGVILGEVASSIIFYVLFVCVRMFTGGYHAKTHFKCKATLLVCCLFVLVGSKLSAEYEHPFWLIISCVLLYLITVLLYAPIEHINAPLTDDLKKRNRKISIIMAMALTAVNICSYWYLKKITVVSSLTLFVVALLIICPKLQERRKKIHEKNDGEAS